MTKDNTLQRIQYLEPEENTYNSLVVDITHRCNMECANCYIPNRTIPDMDVSMLYRFLARLPHRTYIRLIGAEPTMREDLPDIIATVKRLGHKPSLTTNGLKLAHLDYARQLKDVGLDMVLISMNGADDDVVYKALDNGKYANLKTRALSNAFSVGFTSINTGTIIAKGVNQSTIRRQVDLVCEIAASAGVHFDQTKPYNKITPVLRMKSVGAIGRHMGEDLSYSLDELAQLVADQLGIEDTANHLPADGTVYIADTTKYHTAFNSGLDDRIHLVACLLD